MVFILHTVEIYCNLILKKRLDLGLKKHGLPYWARLNFNDIVDLDLKRSWIDFMIYWTWTNLKKLGRSYWTGSDFVINWT